MVGNSRQPNNMGASWSYREFFLRIEPKGTEEKKGNGLPKIRYAKKSPRHTREPCFLSYCTPLVCFFSIDDT